MIPGSPSAGAFTFAAVVWLSLVGCRGTEPSAGDDGHTTTTQGAAETTTDDPSETSTETSGTDSNDSTDTDPSSGGSFYAGPDPDFSPALFCDPWAQDCPDGEKCVPYASSGAGYDANKCVPILGDDAPGEPCSSDGPTLATDSCDGDGICWNTADLGGQLLGTCVGFCAGNPDQPECGAGQTCVIANDGALTLCLTRCDPLMQVCGPGLGCFPVGDEFVCMNAGPVQAGNPCDQLASCQAGSVCVLGELLPACDGPACCAQLCSLADPICDQNGVACVPYYESDPPEGLESLGVCLGSP